MPISLIFKVAEHTFRLSLTDNKFSIEDLSNYAPFRINADSNNCLFHLSVVDDLPMTDIYEKLGQFDDDIASIGIFKSQEGSFRFHIAYPGSKDYSTMDIDASFEDAKVKLPDNPEFQFFCLNNCLMLLYAFAAANLDTLLIHASVIKNGNSGFAFLGKSGTGKSTHSRLWFDHIAGSELLNDDNPAIRIIEDKAYIYGTPWSGKTPCYKNNNALLKGIVKLNQAPENIIKKLSSLHSYATILPSCSNMRWEDNIASGIHNAVEKLISIVNCYHLDCLPDKAAAELSYKTIK